VTFQGGSSGASPVREPRKAGYSRPARAATQPTAYTCPALQRAYAFRALTRVETGGSVRNSQSEDMVMERTSLAIFAALICTAAPFAIEQASAQQAGASSSSGKLDDFVGAGTCTGNMQAMGKNPAHATTGRFHAEKTLDGNWAVIHYDEDKTAA